MKLIQCILITVLIGLIYNSQINAQQSKKTVAILNFVNAGGVDNNEISILTDRFSSSLFNANVYKVLEREKMDAILKEQDFKMSDNCNSTECSVVVGQMLGVDIMVAGKIGKLGQTYTVDIRMIDVTTGELLKTGSESYEGKKDGLLGLISSMASSMANKADISADMLEKELVVLQQQNKRLEEDKNQKAQQENLKKQEELKAQLASINQNKKLEQQEKVKSEADKQKAAEELKRKQELFARIEEEKKKQSAIASEGMNYIQALDRISELKKNIELVDQEIETQKQKAISLSVDESPKAEFETQQEYNSRLNNNKQKRKQISDEYDVLKFSGKQVLKEEITAITAKKYIMSKEDMEIGERVSLKLGVYNVNTGYFPITVTETYVKDPCDKEPSQNYVNSKIYVDRDDAKKLRESESLLDVKATARINGENRLIIERITLVDAANSRNYEFTVNLNLIRSEILPGGCGE
jgi:TolB-like protein